MLLFLWAGGVQLLPDTNEEAAAIKLLLSNVRTESLEEFFDGVARKGLGYPVCQRSGKNLNHEQSTPDTLER